MTRYDIAMMCGYNSVEEYDEAEKRSNEIFFEGLKKHEHYVEKEPVKIQYTQEKKYCRMIPLEPDCRGYTDVFICTNCHRHIHLGFIRKEYSGSYCLECGAEVMSRHSTECGVYHSATESLEAWNRKNDIDEKKLSCHFEHCRECLSLIKRRIPDTEVAFEIRCGRKHKGIILKGEQLLSFGDITPEDFDKVEED